MSLVTLDNKVTAISPLVAQTALRRKLSVELSMLGDHLSALTLSDQLTNLLRKWHTSFLDSLRTGCNEKTMLCHYCELLDRILRDPIVQMPLGEDALLGTDGKTYDAHALAVFLTYVPKVTFTTSLHPLVYHFVRWLKEYCHDRPRIREVDAQYDHLKAQGRCPEIPTERAARMARLKERAGVPRAEIEAIRTEALQQVEAVFERIDKRLDAHAETCLAELHAIPEEEAHVLQKLKEEIVLHGEKLEELKRTNEGLKEELNALDRKLSQVEGDDRRLGIAINECQQALAKEQGSSFGGILAAVGVIAGCCAASFLVSSLFSEVSVTIHPIGYGGFGAQISIPF